MGVSVSYKGSGGSRAFNLDGIPTGDAARALGLPKKKHFVPQTLADALRMPQPEDPIKAEKENKVKLNRLDMNPGTLEDKMLPGGGVVVSQRGVCLRGEEDSPLVTGTKLFGSVMGSKKYHSIEEIDPPGSPRHVGAQNADEDPAPNNEPAKVGEPYKYQVASRMVAERDPIAKLLKLYELDKDVSASPMGRTTGVTAERRRLIVAIPLWALNPAYAPVPQPFDPTFEENSETGDVCISAIADGYAPWGRRLIDVTQPGSDSGVWSATSGRLGLKITHPVSASGLPTAEIIVASGRNTFPQSTDALTYLPLYDFDNGRITLDLRCYLALGVYE